MGRFCNGLLTAFRVVQYLFSIIALGCGAYITYEMYSMSASAHTLETSIDNLNADSSQYQDIESSLETLADKLIPVLQFLEGTPVRAIIVAAVGFWSLVVITYLFFAHRSKNHQATNKRWIRVLLELITLLAWIASIACSILLALEFGVMALAAGPELKGAAKVCEYALEQAISVAASQNKNTDAVLNIVDTLVTIGGLSVASVVASGLCGVISFVSLIVACCMSGKNEKRDAERGAETSMIADPETIIYASKGSPMDHVSETVSYHQSPAMMTTRY